MKMYYAPNAFAPAHEAQAPQEDVPARGRNAKMDQFLRQVNGSKRYSATSLEEQTKMALSQPKKPA